MGMHQASKFMGLGFAVLLCGAFVIPACDSGGDDDDSSNAGNNSGGSASGNTNGGTAGSTAGNTNGGTGGATGGTGGSSSFSCPGVVPPSIDITNFTALMPTNAPMWGATPAMGAFYGGLFAYGGPSAVPTTDVSNNNLHATGSVKDFSGFGLYIAYCADASKFDGVRFKISSEAGKTKSVLFAVQTNINLYPDPMAMKGECMATPANKFIDCVPPGYTVANIGPEPQVVEVTWDKLAGGRPATNATTLGKDIVGFQWSFPWAMGMMPYDVDVTIDDVEFIGMGAGGSGTGGAGNDPGMAGAGGA
jgi:hypothetical protein